MIENIDPRILAPLTAGQIMLYCFDGEDWSRFFRGIKGCDVHAWTRAYHIYLQSIAWQKKSRERREMDGNQCQTTNCFRVDSLQVHHKTYANIGNEDVANDLITLCESCHATRHAKESRA